MRVSVSKDQDNGAHEFEERKQDENYEIIAADWIEKIIQDLATQEIEQKRRQ